MHTGFIRKKYNKLFYAAVIGWMVSVIGDAADSIIAGIFLGEEAVAAVELVQPIYSIVFCVACFLAMGTSTLFSNYQGAFEEEKASKLCGTTLVLSIGIGIVMCAALIFSKDAYFAYYGSAPEIEAMARGYYDCFVALSLLYPAYWLLYCLVCADGDETIILYCDLITAVGNAVVSVVLVQKLGVVGLGIGTLVATLLPIALLIAHLFKKNNSIKFKFSFDFKNIGSILIIGSSESLTNLYIAIIDVVMNKLIIERFGDEYLAAYAVVNLILNMAACFDCGICSGSPFIGVARGENNPVAMSRMLSLVTKTTAVVGGLFMVGMWILAPWLPEFYGVTDPVVYEAAVYAGRVLALSYSGTWFLYELIGYYPRIKKVLFANLLGFIYMLAAPIAFVPVLSKWFGFEGLVWGFFLTPFAALLVSFVVIAVKYGVKKYPFLIEESKDMIYMHEFAVNEHDIVMLCEVVGKDLEANGVDKSITNKAQLMLEETLLLVKEKNAEKMVLADCTVMINDEYVKIITRDNGIIFDVTDTDKEVESFGSYVTARLMAAGQKNSYLTSISFNRNSFTWDR